jgi:hypothetical protein
MNKLKIQEDYNKLDETIKELEKTIRCDKKGFKRIAYFMSWEYDVDKNNLKIYVQEAKILETLLKYC